MNKQDILNLLRDCFEEEIAHLQLRIIRDTQEPMFKALKETHPEIFEDFMKARNGPHEILKGIREKRIETLKRMIEEV